MIGAADTYMANTAAAVMDVTTCADMVGTSSSDVVTLLLIMIGLAVGTSSSSYMVGTVARNCLLMTNRVSKINFFILIFSLRRDSDRNKFIGMFQQ